MIGTIIFLLSLTLALATAFSTKDNMTKMEKSPYRGGEDVKVFNFAWIFKPLFILLFGVVLSLVQPYKLERVDAGHLGIKVKLTGDDRGVSDYTYKTGWVVYNSWTENLYEFPTFQQHIDYAEQQVITKGGFAAMIKPTFNYSLKSDKIGDMFVNLRVGVKQVEQGWLNSAICGSVNDVANKWSVDDIFNNREQFEAAIITECNKRVIKWFTISQLRTNIVPPQALQKAIEDKTKAIQEAQGEMQKALVADAQAKVKIANAKGDSAQTVIRASGNANAAIITARGEAQAMKEKQKELSPLYVDYIRATRWTGEYPSTMLTGGNALLNLK